MSAAQKETAVRGDATAATETKLDVLHFTAPAQRHQALAAADHLRVPLIRGAKALNADPELLDIRPLFMRTSPAADPANARAKLEGNAIMACNEPVAQRKGFKPTRMALCITDLDEGNLTSDDCRFAISDFFGSESIACVYSTSSSCPSSRRWRLIVPLAQAVSVAVWMQVQRAFGVYLESVKIKADPCMEDRATQLSFLPNVPPEGRHPAGVVDPFTGEDLSGKPFHFEHAYWGTALFDPVTVPTQAAADALRQLAERDAAEAEAQRQRHEAAERKASERAAERALALANGGDGMSIVERFNATNDTASLLLQYGYAQSPEKPTDWRSPMQKSGTYATQLRDDGSWFSLSGSDAAAGLGSPMKGGVGGDAFDLFVHFAHGGNYKAAVASLVPKADVGVFTGEPMPEGYGPADVLIPFGGPRGGAKRYKLQPPAEFMSRPPAEWALKDIMPRRGVMTVYGQSGSGKTFLVLDLLLTLLDPLREEWCGERIRNRPSAVVYLALEGASGVRSRLKAWEQDNDGRAVPDNFHVIDQDSFNFTQPADVQGLIDSVREDYPQGKVIVVVDTQAKATVGADEQTAKDMGVVFAAAERIAQGIDGLCVTVTHAGKDLAKGVRGSSSQTGAADLIMLVTREGDARSWEITKNKDGAEDKVGYFSLDTVQIGVDRDGDPIEAAVVVHEGKPQALRAKRIGKSGQIGIDAFHLARSRSGSDCVGLEVLRAAFYEKHGGDNLPAKRQAFHRALKALIDSKTLVESTPGFYVVPMGETAAPFTGIQPPLTVA